MSDHEHTEPEPDERETPVEETADDDEGLGSEAEIAEDQPQEDRAVCRV